MTSRTLLLLSLIVLTAPLACDSGFGDAPGTTPELLQDTFRIVDNPAEEGDIVVFQVAFEDLDGDMRRADVILDLLDPDGELLPVELDDRFDQNLNGIEIDGTTRGTIRFELEALAEYDDGEFQLAVQDLAGHRSNTVTAYFYVNLSED